MGSPKLLNGADMSSQKVVHVADGSASDDAAAFGQVPTALPPNGTAGGNLAGSYPNPTIAAGVVTEAMQVTADNTTANVSSTKHGYAPKSPADATQYLNGAATNAYTTPGLAIYGDGSDGALHFDGSTTILGLVPSGSVYTLTRDIFASSITIDNGVTITGQYRIFCTGTLTNNGTIKNDGGNASAGTAGTACARGAYPPSGAGGASTASAATLFAGTAGTTAGVNPAGALGIFCVGGANGGNGGNVGASGGGSFANAFMASPRHPIVALMGLVSISSSASSSFASGGSGDGLSAFVGGPGGGSGKRTAGTTATIPGAGGAGGGIVLIAARIIVNSSGTISANGGNGGNATGAGDCVTGGGGGGAGGCVWLIYNSATFGTETATGGSHGTGLNGAAAPLTDGLVGNVYKIPNQ